MTERNLDWELVVPALRYEASFREYLAELGNEERYPFVLDLDSTDFNAYLQQLDDLSKGHWVPEGGVPSSTYWLVKGETLIGVANLRHYLNDNIAHVGGHIGMGVRPSYRGKGLSSLLLHKTVEIARSRSINPVHIHCYTNNLPSNGMVLSVGGVLDSKVTEGNVQVSRYLVEN
ncbi:GNAT family N-acetyltransferase [Alteromonas sp. KUL49]|uniref:GNAT family N-acetyltransferase n=1 Tax=Alteromonas sp. KUL49 TaxID=2480798 RepID=UPI00102EFB3E|nr:GNAT family N-acetyltransferase [Alteromonas sp. KUL49]TAP40154.1 GNAT family N-acetyltransferase [Alteromonas sp. KUL49]GEA11272.1 acetyltransferase [Alteromonas sp. KUL49]